MIVKVNEEEKISFSPPTEPVINHQSWIRKAPARKRYFGSETFVPKKVLKQFERPRPRQSVSGVATPTFTFPV